MSLNPSQLDNREAILARLVEIARTLTTHVYRNQTDIPEDSRPAIVILDGDEEDAQPFDNRPVRRVYAMSMSPEIYLVLGDMADDVGPALNTWRSALVRAIATDQTLVALCKDGEIQYSGMTTGLAVGRSMEAEARLDFAFRYVLRPA